MARRSGAAVGFGVALLMIAAIGWVLYRNTADVIAAAGAVAHTHEGLAELTALLSEIAAAEMIPHAYVIASAGRPLEPFSMAVEAIDHRLEHLRQLTADNANQQQRISLLKGLIDEKIAQLQHMIDVQWEEGFPPEVQLALTNLGKTLMDRIRWVIETMKGEERAILLRRSEVLQSRTRLTYATITFSIGLPLVLLALMGYLLMREAAERTRVETELRKAKEGPMACTGDSSHDRLFPQS
jgi:methyl-accepting chemotaxis protein